MKLSFTKMHGLGNDFVFIDGRKAKISNPKKLAKDLCDRRFGVGADQMLVLERSRKADFQMKIYNADGGEVEMCGNGLRCLAKYVHDKKLTSKNDITVETAAGIQRLKIISKNKIRVDMGSPILRGNEIPVRLSGRVINRPIRVDGKEFRATCVSMGNPHCVIFVDELKIFPSKNLALLSKRTASFQNGPTWSS